MSRVFPTTNQRWAVKMSIGNRISRLSTKNLPARKVAIQQPITKKQPSKISQNGLANFIAESKRQTVSDAQETIRRIEQWQRQTCAIFDMVQQHFVHNLQDGRHESVAVKNVKKTAKKATSNKPPVKKLSVRKSTAVAKKPSSTPKKSATIAKKPLVSAKAPTTSTVQSKTPMKKPSKSIGRPKKSSKSSTKQSVKKPSEGNARGSTEQNLDCLPDLSSDSSSEESVNDVPAAAVEKSSCPSMPILQTEGIESDDNLNAFMNKPIECQSKTVKMRRRSDFALPPISNFTVRKKPMPVHSSVLAISNRSPNIVLPMPNGEPEAATEIRSTPVRAVDKTNNVRKSVEKEPEPIHNCLTSNSPVQDDNYAKIIELRKLRNALQAKNDGQKGNALNGKSGDVSGSAYPIQEALAEL